MVFHVRTPIIVAVALLAVFTTSTHATVITMSANAPVVDGADLANLTQDTAFEDFQSSFEWPDRGARGQTFTTGGNVPGYTLNAITVQSDKTTVGSASYRVRVGSVSGTSFTSFTPETGNFGAVADNEFVTFTLDTPLLLSANTVYGFDIGLFSPSPNAFATVGWQLRNNTGQFAGGQRYTSTGPTQETRYLGSGTVSFHNPADSDRIFHLDLTANSTGAVPEPATATIALFGLGGLMMRRWRIA